MRVTTRFRANPHLQAEAPHDRLPTNTKPKRLSSAFLSVGRPRHKIRKAKEPQPRSDPLASREREILAKLTAQSSLIEEVRASVASALAHAEDHRATTLRSRHRSAIAFAIVGALLGVVFANLFWDVAVLVQRPTLIVAGKVEPFLTYVYPPDPNGTLLPNGFRILDASLPQAHLPGGSLYMYNQTFRNEGVGPLQDLVLTLNLPGVPVVTWSDRGDTQIDAEPAVVKLFNFMDGTTPISYPTWDPRILRPPTFTKVELPLFLDGEPIFTIGPAYAWRGNTTVIGANGTQTVSYQLDSLGPGDEWNVKTIYFGHENQDSAAGSFSAAGLSFDHTPRPKLVSLTTFGPRASGFDDMRVSGWTAGGGDAFWRSLIPFWWFG